MLNLLLTNYIYLIYNSQNRLSWFIKLNYINNYGLKIKKEQ